MNTSLKAFFREHPTMLLTLCYFVITVIGVLYSYYFYQQFSIQIIKFADLSDFLLASILEPLSVLIFVGIVIILSISYMSDIWLRKKYPWYGRFASKRLQAKYTDPIGFLLVIIFLTSSLVQTIAQSNAEGIKKGTGDQFLVRISDPGELAAEQTLALLGATSRYAYFYDNSKQQALVIPVENVSYMRKLILVEIDKTNTLDEKKPITVTDQEKPDATQ